MDLGSPLVCFLLGVLSSVLTLGILAICLRSAVARHRALYPDGLPEPSSQPGSTSNLRALQQRLQELESRLAEVEAERDRQVTA
jgi:hypothetical protein